MTRSSFLAVLALVSGLAGCAQMTAPQDTSSSGSGTAAAAPAFSTPPGPAYKISQYDVADITVSVPAELTVSEANLFFPAADIVWRGEPVGDRHAQVAAMVTEAMATGTAMMTKGRSVDVDVVVTRFHCVTERTRYSIGGVHSMQFEMTVRDAATGDILDGPRLVVADTPAAGGAKALAEDQAGQTQRVVVMARIAEVIRAELSLSVASPDDPVVAMASAGPAVLLPR